MILLITITLTCRLHYDGLHFNMRGHAALARNINKYLRSI